MRQYLLLTFLLSILFSTQIYTQNNTPMRVLHCSAISQQAAIKNIYVNAANEKFVATNNQLFQLYSADNATPVTTSSDQWYLLLENNGDYQFTTPKTTIETIINDTTETEATKINTASFEPNTQTLWIGTAKKGLFQINAATSSLSLVNHFTTDNSKLKSNAINALLTDKYGRFWAGTDQGIFMRETPEDDFKLFEKREKILDITALGPDVWILGKDILWMADEKNRWIPGDVDSKLYQGSVRDIQYDSEGRLWVASEIITRYDVQKDLVERFDKSKGFDSQNVSVIRVDAEDALWVGTFDKGLYLIEKASVMTVSCEVTTPLSCKNQQATAALKVKLFGGTAPYQYRWDNGLSGEQPTNVGPGVYTVTVTDADGQTRKASAKVERPTIFASAKLLTPATDKDGKAMISNNGGTAPYTYRWDNGESSATATALSVGTHVATITDSQACMTTVTVDVNAAPIPEVPVEPEVTSIPEQPVATAAPEPVNVPVEEPIIPLAVQLSFKADLKCAGDQSSISAKSTGGKAPYLYQWSMTDEASETVSQVKAGNHQLTVTDALGNTIMQDIAISAPPIISVKSNVLEMASDATSRNGKAKLLIDGGTAPYVVLWDNGETKPTAEKLKAGSHSVSVSDANNCETVTQVVVKKKIIAALDVKKLQRGQTIQIDQLYFDADSTDVKPTSQPVLEEIYAFLVTNPNITVEIGGHTNNIPSHDYCDALSTARAKSVVDYLNRKGIAGEQITYKGYGKRKPLVTNKTAAGRRKNQRVEIKVLQL